MGGMGGAAGGGGFGGFQDFAESQFASDPRQRFVKIHSRRTKANKEATRLNVELLLGFFRKGPFTSSQSEKVKKQI